ncbi:Sporulation initiation inhibitor protein Soj [subsurface metagenome]
MSKVIALINQKGGVGKTTTAANLGTALCQLKKRILLVDMDPQANLSYHLLGAKVHDLESSIYDSLTGKVELKDVLVKRKDGLEVIPSGIDLSGFEIELARKTGRETLLKASLSAARGYEYVIVDCPPSLGLLTLNVLVAVKEIFIPLQVEFFALQGIPRLLESIGVVKDRLNKSLKVGGVVLCMYDIRRRLSKEIEDKIRDYFKGKVFKTVIRENVSLAEAPSYGQSIFEYAPRSHGAEDYLKLAREVIHHG